MDFVIHVELIPFQIDACKESIFGKRVISEEVSAGRDHFVHSPPLLMIAAQQKEYLCLKCVPFAVAIKIREKGILLKDLQKDFSVERILKKAGESGLADS